MIKKLTSIGLIAMTLVVTGCDRRGNDDVNPDAEENNTTSRIEKKIEK